MSAPAGSRAGSIRSVPAFFASSSTPSSSIPATSAPSSSSSSSSSSSLFSLPPKWLRSYDAFIARNLGQVSQIESALRSLTYVIPGRFRDAEIASETIHSSVQLLSLYHDLLLLRTPSTPPGLAAAASSARPPGPSPPPPTQHTRYTRYWTDHSALYRRVAVVLRIVQYTELLCEMAAKRRGERLRWRVVVLLEAVKAFCRLLLLRVTRGRTLLQPVLPVRQPLAEAAEEEDEEMVDEEEGEEMVDEKEEEKPADKVSPPHTPAQQPLRSLPPPGGAPPLSPPPSPSPSKATAVLPRGAVPPSPPLSPAASAASVAPAAALHTAWTMPRTGMALPPLPQPGDLSAYLQGRVLTADDIKAAPRLLHPLHGTAYVAEVLQILTPLVFAAALANSRAGPHAGTRGRLAAWTPWLAGLAMECGARQLREHNNNGLRTTTLEHDEWNRRGWSMGWWAMRGAFYDHAMKGVVAGVRARLPSFVGGILEDYEYLWDNYYFSTSP